MRYGATPSRLLRNISPLRSSCENFPRVFSCYIQLPPPPDPLIRLPWGHFRLGPTEMRGPPSHLTWERDKAMKADLSTWKDEMERSITLSVPTVRWGAVHMLAWIPPLHPLRCRCHLSPVGWEERDRLSVQVHIWAQRKALSQQQPFGMVQRVSYFKSKLQNLFSTLCSL